MPALVVAIVLATQVVYKWSPTLNVDYDVNVKMDGFLPILGGNEGVAEVTLGLRVKGAVTTDTNLKATSELTSAVIKFNDAELPLGLKDVVSYFPKASVVFSPLGEIISNDAPDKKPPVKLPGLDVKRLPDISFLAMQFPAAGVSVGDTWSFDKSFDNSVVHYDCTAVAVDKEKVSVDVKVKQDQEYDETETLEVAKDPKDATGHVKTVLTGGGKVDFDPVLGVVRSVEMDSQAVTTVKDIKTGATKERHLKQVLRVKEKGLAPAQATTATNKSWWDSARVWGQEMAVKGAFYWRALQAWLAGAIRTAPWKGR